MSTDPKLPAIIMPPQGDPDRQLALLETELRAHLDLMSEARIIEAIAGEHIHDGQAVVLRRDPVSGDTLAEPTVDLNAATFTRADLLQPAPLTMESLNQMVEALLGTEEVRRVRARLVAQQESERAMLAAIGFPEVTVPPTTEGQSILAVHEHGPHRTILQVERPELFARAQVARLDAVDGAEPRNGQVRTIEAVEGVLVIMAPGFEHEPQAGDRLSFGITWTFRGMFDLETGERIYHPLGSEPGARAVASVVQLWASQAKRNEEAGRARHNDGTVFYDGRWQTREEMKAHRGRPWQERMGGAGFTEEQAPAPAIAGFHPGSGLAALFPPQAAYDPAFSISESTRRCIQVFLCAHAQSCQQEPIAIGPAQLSPLGLRYGATVHHLGTQPCVVLLEPSEFL